MNLNNRQTGKDATKPRTPGFSGHSVLLCTKVFFFRALLSPGHIVPQTHSLLRRKHNLLTITVPKATEPSMNKNVNTLDLSNISNDEK